MDYSQLLQLFAQNGQTNLGLMKDSMNQPNILDAVKGSYQNVMRQKMMQDELARKHEMESKEFGLKERGVANTERMTDANIGHIGRADDLAETAEGRQQRTADENARYHMLQVDLENKRLGQSSMFHKDNLQLGYDKLTQEEKEAKRRDETQRWATGAQVGATLAGQRTQKEIATMNIGARDAALGSKEEQAAQRARAGLMEAYFKATKDGTFNGSPQEFSQVYNQFSLNGQGGAPVGQGKPKYFADDTVEIDGVRYHLKPGTTQPDLSRPVARPGVSPIPSEDAGPY
jgi:hypothetical protein